MCSTTPQCIEKRQQTIEPQRARLNKGGGASPPGRGTAAHLQWHQGQTSVGCLAFPLRIDHRRYSLAHYLLNRPTEDRILRKIQSYAAFSLWQLLCGITEHTHHLLASLFNTSLDGNDSHGGCSLLSLVLRACLQNQQTNWSRSSPIYVWQGQLVGSWFWHVFWRTALALALFFRGLLPPPTHLSPPSGCLSNPLLLAQKCQI